MSEAVRQKVLKNMLRDCTIWMFNTPTADNPTEDEDGHQNRSVRDQTPKDTELGKVWILPGYFNTYREPATPDGTPKIKRTMTMDDEDKLFVMVASSHASKWEKESIERKGGGNKTLKEIAIATQGIWQQLKMYVDGVPERLELVTMDDEVNVDIPKDHPFIRHYDHLNPQPGPTPVISSAYCALLEFPDGGTHTIDFYAKSPGDDLQSDPQYEVDVRYRVRVNPTS